MANKTDLDENQRIGRLLQIARESRGVTQQEMAAATGMSKNHISAIERGVSKASVTLLLGYCRKLSMRPNEILMFLDGEIVPELRDLLNGMDAATQRKLCQMGKILKG